MKKKFLLLLILFSCLFVTKVSAARLGSLENPDRVVRREYYHVTRTNMSEYMTDGYRVMYYTYQIEVESFSYIYFLIDSPAVRSVEDPPDYFLGVSQPVDNLDDPDFIDDIYYAIPFQSEKVPFFTELEPGTYYIIVGFAMEDQENYYEYSMGFEYDFYPMYSEMEPNDYLDDANSIVLNTMYDGTIDDDEDPDVFKVNLTAGKKVRVYFDDYEYCVGDGLTFSIYDELFVDNHGNITESQLKYDSTRGEYYYEFTPTKSRLYYIRLASSDERIFYYFGVYQSGTTSTYMMDVVNLIDFVSQDSKREYVYRLYNPVTSEHLYTMDVNEVNVLYKNYGWGFEGPGWSSYKEGTPVYRLYNPGLGNHLYTSDEYEIRELTKYHGWVKDNNGQPVMYSTLEGNNVPVYRVYNEALRGMHHLTTDQEEYEALPEYGWKQEGIVMYVPGEGTSVPTEYYNVNF